MADILGMKDGFILRSARLEDADSYYEQNFNPLDPELRLIL